MVTFVRRFDLDKINIRSVVRSEKVETYSRWRTGWNHSSSQCRPETWTAGGRTDDVDPHLGSVFCNQTSANGVIPLRD